MAFKDVFWFGTDLWDPSNRFQTSWLLSPWILFTIRFLIGLYALVTRLFSIVWTCEHEEFGGCQDSRQSFSYFTCLCYWGTAFYFLVAALHTSTYALRGANRSTLDNFPRPLQALHSLFYTTIVVYPFIVTIVYWGALFPGNHFYGQFRAWENVSQHALNSVFALFEIFIPRTATPPWVHMFWLIIILAMYLALAYLTYATQGFYTYPFLDYTSTGSRGLVAAYIFGIAVGTIIVFCIVWGLIWLRKWITEKKLGFDGKVSKKVSYDRDVEMEGTYQGVGYRG